MCVAGVEKVRKGENSREVVRMAPHEQVDRFVIRYMTGDAEPLPYIWIEPVSKPNIEAEIAVDNHLMSAGVRLSKRDMLQRYGRAKADPDDPDSVPTARHGVGARTDSGIAWTLPHPRMDATPYAGRASGRGGAGARRGALSSGSTVGSFSATR